MSDDLPIEQESDYKLTSERYDAFLDALETLYLTGNTSGRIAFMKAWPEAAEYLFGKELVQFDTEGTDDRAHRAKLEEKAETRREKFLDIVQNLEDRSVHKGALQTEYVETLIKGLGRELALVIYAPRYVDRFIPSKASDEESKPTTSADDMYDDVRPISLEPPPIEPQTEIPAPPPVEQSVEDELDVPDGPIRFEDLKKMAEEKKS